MDSLMIIASKKIVSQSSRLARRENSQIVFPATCAAEKLPEAKRYASPRADQPKGDGARVPLAYGRKPSFRPYAEKRAFQRTLSFLVPVAGLEPARLAALDFESSTSTNSITPACLCIILQRQKIFKWQHGRVLPAVHREVFWTAFPINCIQKRHNRGSHHRGGIAAPDQDLR